MAPPPLADEVIGCIFTHLEPTRWGLYRREGPEMQTLKICGLVNRQFGFWSRRSLYRTLKLRQSHHPSHYLDLCHRYDDMASHIKILKVVISGSFWQGADGDRGYDSMISLLDLLSLQGAVLHAHFDFMIDWDNLKLNLQDSIIRFITSRPFETLEIRGICFCFPLIILPVPWMAKRFAVSKFVMDGDFDEDGEVIGFCPHWDRKRRELGIQNRREERKLDPRLVRTIRSTIERRTKERTIHTEKTALKSLWIPSETAHLFLGHLLDDSSNVCISSMRELSFMRMSDEAITIAVIFMQSCKDTLESLTLWDIHVQSATSSHLSELTNIDLPKLHTLTIGAQLKSNGEPTKSVAWYLLHANKHKKFKLKSLNFIFFSLEMNSGPMSREGSGTNVAQIDKLFESFKFFKFEKLVNNILVPDVGKAGIWVLMSSFPGPVEDLLVEEGLKKEFPNLFGAKRITGMVGEFDEGFKLASALSLYPEGPPFTRHHITYEGVTKPFATNLKDTVLRPWLSSYRQRSGQS